MTILAPTNLTATKVLPNSVQLDWVDNSNNEDGFKIERKRDDLGIWAVIHSTAPNIITYTDTPVDFAYNYTYRVRAFDVETPYQFVGKFGTDGYGNGQFRRPIGILVNGSFIYVTDNIRGDVQLFSKTSPWPYSDKFIVSCSAEGSGLDSGHIYTALELCSKVRKHLITSPFTNIQTWGSTYGSGDNQFKLPACVAVDDNYIYTIDIANNRVQIFLKNSPYTFVDKFGSAGSGDGQFNADVCIKVDANFIYVGGGNNGRIQLFNKTPPYAFVDKFTVTVYFFDVDDPYIYSAGKGDSKIHVNNKTSPFAQVAEFGGAGSGDGQFGQVQGVTYDERYLYTTEYSNHRVQVFTKGATLYSDYSNEAPMITVAVDKILPYSWNIWNNIDKTLPYSWAILRNTFLDARYYFEMSPRDTIYDSRQSVETLN